MVFNERWRARLCALALAAAFSAAASAGNTGLAFVHGTGSQRDATNEYGTREMIDAVRRGVARRMVPHSIALVVRLLDRAAERMAI